MTETLQIWKSLLQECLLFQNEGQEIFSCCRDGWMAILSCDWNGSWHWTLLSTRSPAGLSLEPALRGPCCPGIRHITLQECKEDLRSFIQE